MLERATVDLSAVRRDVAPACLRARWMRSAVITDRHMLVVWQKRIVRPKELPDVCGMMNAHIEIGVVTDPRREMQRTICCAM